MASQKRFFRRVDDDVFLEVPGRPEPPRTVLATVRPLPRVLEVVHVQVLSLDEGCPAVWAHVLPGCPDATVAVVPVRRQPASRGERPPAVGARERPLAGVDTLGRINYVVNKVCSPLFGNFYRMDSEYRCSAEKFVARLALEVLDV